MATTCPICQKGKLKKSEKMVYCSEKNTIKTGAGFEEKGCKFKIFFDQKKVFGADLTPTDVKNLVEGEPVTSPKGHTMTLDPASDFFTKIDFAQKEDEDL